MHDAYTIGIPVLVILIANFLNRADLKELRVEMNARFEKVDARFDRMQTQIDKRFDEVDKRFNAIDAELGYFHGVTGKLDGRIEAIEKGQ